MLIRLFSYITIGDMMKVERLDNGYFIFFNSSYIGNIPSKKEDIIVLVKDLLLKKRYILHLSGFYKVKVYFDSKVGIFLILNLLDRLNNDLELRVVVYMNDKIYFKTRDYFSLPKNVVTYYYQSYYFCEASKVSFSNLEFGEYLFGERLYPYYFLWKKCRSLQ